MSERTVMNQQAYVNQINMVGRVGQEPDTKYFESGSVKTSLTLAVKPPYRSENPLWFDLEMWGNIAEVAASYVKKGSTIGIVGELVIDKWNDKNTDQERSKPLIRVSNLELISSARNSEANISTDTTSTKSVSNANF